MIHIPAKLLFDLAYSDIDDCTMKEYTGDFGEWTSIVDGHIVKIDGIEYEIDIEIKVYTEIIDGIENIYSIDITDINITKNGRVIKYNRSVIRTVEALLHIIYK
jgi:hypothetical protein